MSDKMKKRGMVAKAAYQREWRRKHPTKQKEYQERYWERRAMREEMKQKEMLKNGGDNETVSDN